MVCVKIDENEPDSVDSIDQGMDTVVHQAVAHHNLAIYNRYRLDELLALDATDSV